MLPFGAIRVPGVALEDQGLNDMVTMRDVAKGISTGGDGSTTCEGGGGDARATDLVALEKPTAASIPWAQKWTGPPHIYFGHDAKRGLQLEAWATGLDTGCLYGKKLSAVILELGKPRRIVSVPALRTYVVPGTKAGGVVRWTMLPWRVGTRMVVAGVVGIVAGTCALWWLRRPSPVLP